MRTGALVEHDDRPWVVVEVGKGALVLAPLLGGEELVVLRSEVRCLSVQAAERLIAGDGP